MEASILKKFLWRSAARKGSSNSHATSLCANGISRLGGDAFEGRSIMTPPAVKGKITPARQYQKLQDIWTNCAKMCSQFVGSLSCKPFLESKGQG